MRNYIEEYANAIKSGSVTVGKWIRMEYESIVNGIRSGKYDFDAEKATDAVDWIEEHCFHTEGPLAPGNLKLELWQKALVSCIFGVLEPGTGRKQFREVVLTVARKNGKSALGSAIVKYAFYNGDNFGTRIYCTAPRLEQAALVYDSVWNMIQLDPEWQAEEEAIRDSIQGHNKKSVDDSMHARKRASDIYIPGKNAAFKKQAFSEKRSDGFNPSLVVCDEIASWPGDKGLKQYEVWKSAAAAREMGDNPTLILSCSTSGYINDGIYDELIKRSTAVILGASKETKLLPFLYMVDDADKWNDLEELKKANPNMGVSVPQSYLIEEIAVAEGSLSKRAEFITKYCCLKQNSSQAWFEFSDIEKCVSEPMLFEQFRNSYAVCGIDLSQTTDLTSACCVIERDGILYVFSHFWMPESRIENATAEDGVPYEIMRKRGFLSLSGENYVDYHDVFAWMTRLVEEYQIFPLQVGYDRFSAQYLVDDLKAYGFHCDDVIQGFNLTPVIREFEGIVKDGKIRIGDNPLLQAHLLNSALKLDLESKKVKLVKVSRRARIDGCAALLDAMCVRQAHYAEIGEQLRN